MGAADIRAGAHRVLDKAWRAYRGYAVPNADTYPHQWLWDSCFHAIAWAALGDGRGQRELHSVFAAQFPSGFVPHMTYAGETIPRGPLDHASSLTQPPLYAHAARRLADCGFPPPAALLAHVGAGLDWLWRRRRGPAGLLHIVHPWEAGSDDSPRWDSWVGSGDWELGRWSAFDVELLAAVRHDVDGAALSSEAFEAAPAGFNALAAHAAGELAQLGGDELWAGRSRDLAAAIDEELWDDHQGLWVDLAVTGGGDSVAAPTLDGVLPALVTANRERAARALDVCEDEAAFSAPFGLAFVARSHPAFDGDGYWRGSAWMPLNYLVREAAMRWERHHLAAAIAAASEAAADRGGFAEHWNPLTGAGRGARPQTWSALVAAMVD